MADGLDSEVAAKQPSAGDYDTERHKSPADDGKEAGLFLGMNRTLPSEEG